MIPRYIVFQNDERDAAQAVVMLGSISHAKMWAYLQRCNNRVFAHALSAGMVTYSIKRRKFVVSDNSVSLNLVPFEDDDKIVQATFSDSPKLRLVVSDFGMGIFPDFSFLLGSSDLLKAEYFQGNKICGIDQAQFHIHDSKRPIKFGTSNLPKAYVFPEYVDYMENRFSA